MNKIHTALGVTALALWLLVFAIPGALCYFFGKCLMDFGVFWGSTLDNQQ